MVMFAPGGIASLIMMNVRLAAYRQAARGWRRGTRRSLATVLVMLAGAAVLIEMFYQLQLGAGNETHISVTWGCGSTRSPRRAGSAASPCW